MTEAMPFLQKYDITFLRPPTIWGVSFSFSTFWVSGGNEDLPTNPRLL